MKIPVITKRQQLRKIKRETLDYVNVIRSEFELPPLQELPQGHRKLSKHCVLAKALKEATKHNKVHVTGTGYIRLWDTDGHEHVWQPTETTKAFVGLFDQGEFPELIIERR